MRLEAFLKPKQEELFGILCKMYPDAFVHEGEYILVPGEAPVLLVAHLDTVHKDPVRQICKTSDGNILMSPQGIGGDDRCGVYALVTACANSEKKPWLLFTCNEEIGCVGANTFCDVYSAGGFPEELNNMKLLIEIDRAGRTDAVYYDCDNPDFEQYINSKGFVTQHGSFSDISCIAPELGIAAVNLSSGYYNAHKQHEYINRRHLDETIQKVLEIVKDVMNPDFPVYKYIARSNYRSLGLYLSKPMEKYRGKLKSKMPGELRHEYLSLLYMYSEEELELIYEEEGEWAIRSLYETEFGRYY